MGIKETKELNMTQRKKDNGNNIAAAFLIGAGLMSTLLAAGTDDARMDADIHGYEVEDIASSDTTGLMSIAGVVAMGAGAWMLHKNEKER